MGEAVMATPTPLTLDQLLALPSREFIILTGKDGSGKSSAVASLAAFVNMMNPDATFWMVDTENKFPAILKAWGADAPRNLQYFHCPDMNAVTAAVDHILESARPGDWFAAESMSRIWEKSQDLGYMTVVGLAKADYMEKRQAQKSAGQKQSPVTPRPDDLWSITKGAHDGAFLERIAQHEFLNVILTTTVSKPPKEGFRKESDSRATVRQEFGIDMGIDGAPRLPYYAQTFAMLDRRQNQTWCRVIRDNNSTKDVAEVEFLVPDRKTFAMTFWTECR